MNENGPLSTEQIATLHKTLQETNELLLRQNRNLESWRLPLRNAVLAGLGGVIGATLLIGLLLAILKPFEKLSPALDQIARELQHK
jgi:hypothetical protein